MTGFRYTIGTENREQEALIAMVRALLSCFTVHEGIGAWKGSLESSLTFDFTLSMDGIAGSDHYVTEFDCDARANYVASEIRAFNSQEAVVFIKQVVEVFYIYT